MIYSMIKQEAHQEVETVAVQWVETGVCQTLSDTVRYSQKLSDIVRSVSPCYILKILSDTVR